MKILLVEDEVHKMEELSACLQAAYPQDASIKHVDSVRAAVLSVSENDYDLIVLDMALPTFSADGGGTERGHDQALGGVEVLRALKSRGSNSRIIIITQYPEITIGGSRVKLNAAPPLLSKRYGQKVVAGVLYKYRSKSNAIKMQNILKKIR